MRSVFVLGIARSGTNLLARMLSRHPAVEVALDPLMPVFRSLRNAVVLESLPLDRRRDFDPGSPFQDGYFAPEGPATMDAILAGSARLPISQEELRHLLPSVVERAALESSALATRMQSIEGSQFDELFRSALEIVAASKPAAAWVGLKELWVLDFVPLLRRSFPDARFYALQRDPRAIVASLIAMSDRDSSQAAHVPSYIRHWRKSVALARRFAADPEISKQFRVVPYESIVAQPEIEARRLCQELEIDFSPDMLELSSDGWTGNSSYEHGGRNVYATSAARWRDSLPPQVLQTIDFLCGPEMLLTEYRRVGQGGLSDEVVGYLRRCAANPGSWRSDSGDLFGDLGGEILRERLLRDEATSDTELVRRCFIFEDTYAAIRSAMNVSRRR